MKPKGKAQVIQSLGAEFLSQMRPLDAEWNLSNALVSCPPHLKNNLDGVRYNPLERVVRSTWFGFLTAQPERACRQINTI